MCPLNLSQQTRQKAYLLVSDILTMATSPWSTLPIEMRREVTGLSEIQCHTLRNGNSIF